MVTDNQHLQQLIKNHNNVELIYKYKNTYFLSPKNNPHSLNELDKLYFDIVYNVDKILCLNLAFHDAGHTKTGKYGVGKAFATYHNSNIDIYFGPTKELVRKDIERWKKSDKKYSPKLSWAYDFEDIFSTVDEIKTAKKYLSEQKFYSTQKRRTIKIFDSPLEKRFVSYFSAGRSNKSTVRLIDDFSLNNGAFKTDSNEKLYDLYSDLTNFSSRKYAQLTIETPDDMFPQKNSVLFMYGKLKKDSEINMVIRLANYNSFFVPVPAFNVVRSNILFKHNQEKSFFKRLFTREKTDYDKLPLEIQNEFPLLNFKYGAKLSFTDSQDCDLEKKIYDSRLNNITDYFYQKLQNNSMKEVK